MPLGAVFLWTWRVWAFQPDESIQHGDPRARVSVRIKLETTMPDVKFKPNSDASDGEETEDEVSDDIIGQPLANFDTPLEVCNTTYEDNVKTEMVDSKAPIKGVLRPNSDSKRKAGLTISKKHYLLTNTFDNSFLITQVNN